MKRVLALLLLSGLFAFATDCSTSSGQSSTAGVRAAATTLLPAPVDEHNPFGEPVSTDGNHPWTVLHRIGYDTAVEHDWKIPSWVSYRIAKEYFAPGAPKYDRLPNFLTDPDLPGSLQITHDHYTGTGYDRGHMAPNASMQGRSEQCARESFYMSNIAPQTAVLNRRIWKNLEDKERQWAKEFAEIWIITGPIFEEPPGIKYMKPKKANLTEAIAIPTHFYKILLRKEGSKHHALAFVIPNQKGRFEDDKDFELWQVAVDDVQALAALDFFRNMGDAEEHEMEAAIEAIWK